MSGGARFDAHQARRKFRKEAGYLCSLQLASNDNLPRCINPMHLEDAFAKVETYRGNLHCGRLLSSWRSPTTTSWHIDAVQQGPSTPSTYDAPLLRLNGRGS